jgi:hypothetical protein
MVTGIMVGAEMGEAVEGEAVEGGTVYEEAVIGCI